MPLPPQTPATPGLQNSALDIVKRALRLSNNLASGENPTSAEAEDGLNALNGMIDAWQIERLMIYTIQRVTTDVTGKVLALTPSAQSYAVGQGPQTQYPQFNIPRPPRIENVSILYLANPNQPLEIPMEMLTKDQWAAIPVKNIQSTIPLQCWNDLSFPSMILNFWCIPSIVNNIALYCWNALSFFPDLNTKLLFPPGYVEALVYSLGIRLAAEWTPDLPIPPALPPLAASAIAKIKSFNQPILNLKCDPALSNPRGGMYDWRSDQYIHR
jgi:hypothetical protein